MTNNKFLIKNNDFLSQFSNIIQKITINSENHYLIAIKILKNLNQYHETIEQTLIDLEMEKNALANLQSLLKNKMKKFSKNKK